MTAALDRRVDAQALFARGCVRFDLGKYIEAEQDFTGALELKFDQAVLFTIRGMARLMQNKLPEADEDATDAFARGATDVRAHSLRAAVRFTQTRYAEAELDFTAAIVLGRNDAWVLCNRGRARQLLGQFADAEQDYDAVIALGIVDADLFVGRGETRMARQKWSEAEQDFAAAIGARRDDAHVHFCLGSAHQAQKRYPQAETEFDLALARDSQPAFHAARGYLRLVRGNFGGAEADLGEVIARKAGDANTLRLRGLARYAQRKFTDALTDYNGALALSPNSALFLASRVVVNLRLGHIDEAAKDCRQLETIDPGGPDTVGCGGALLLANGDFDGALSRFRLAAPNESDWYFWQGLACLTTGRLEEAREAYRQGAAGSSPGDIPIALEELDFYLGQDPSRGGSRETQAAVALIRSDIGHLTGLADSQTV